ncbi:hypothetical protein ACHAQA_003034 [Verticillium albo-atrum]
MESPFNMSSRFEVLLKEELRIAEAALKAARLELKDTIWNHHTFYQTSICDRKKKDYPEIYAEAQLVTDKKCGKWRYRILNKIVDLDETDEDVKDMYDQSIALELYQQIAKQLAKEVEILKKYQRCMKYRYSDRGEHALFKQKAAVLEDLRKCREIRDSVSGETPELDREWTLLQTEVQAALKRADGETNKKRLVEVRAELSLAVSSLTILENSFNSVGQKVVGEESEAIKKLKAAKGPLLLLFTRFDVLKRDSEVGGRHQYQDIKWLMEKEVQRFFAAARTKAGKDVPADPPAY